MVMVHGALWRSCRSYHKLHRSTRSRTVQRESPAFSFPTAPTPELFAALYDELHRLAESHLRRGANGLGLSTTTLLHEAYLDLASRPSLGFPDRSRFLGYAARAMRGIVIDYVRRSRAQKRGGGAFEITLTSIVGASVTCAISAALGSSPRKAMCVARTDNAPSFVTRNPLGWNASVAPNRA